MFPVKPRPLNNHKTGKEYPILKVGYLKVGYRLKIKWLLAAWSNWKPRVFKIFANFFEVIPRSLDIYFNRLLFNVNVCAILSIVRLVGFEPTTCGSEDRRSVRLSYRRSVSF